MSSDKSQSAVGGTAAAIGSVGAREGAMTEKDKRVAIAEASVTARQQDDIGDVLDLSLSSAFRAKTDGQLKNLSGQDLLDEMRYNPLTQAKSGTAWAQSKIAQAGLDKEMDKLIEGTPIVRERQALENIENLMSSKTLTELSPLQVRFLQDNLKELRLYNGKNDGDFTNPQTVAALDNLVKGKETLQKVVDRNGGRTAIDFAWAVRHPEFAASQKAAPATPSGEARIMNLFKDASLGQTAAPAPSVAPITAPIASLWQPKAPALT